MAELTAVSSAAAAGVRSCAGLVLELEVEQCEGARDALRGLANSLDSPG